MLECMSRIEDRLPAVGREALDEARRAHSGRGEFVKLEKHRIRCWQAVELAEFQDRAVEVNALRALIFVLHPPGKEDLVDCLDVFVGFANRAEPHYADLEPTLRKYFGDCVPAATGDRLVVELAQIEEGGEGVLLGLGSVARRYGRLHELRAVEWIVHAVSCAKPNLKLRRVLHRRGFRIQQLAGIGEAYYFVDQILDRPKHD